MMVSGYDLQTEEKDKKKKKECHRPKAYLLPMMP